MRHSHSSRPEIVISGTIKMRSTRFDINIFITSSRLQSHTRIFFSVTGRPTLTAHVILFSGELLMSQRLSPRWLVYTLWKWLKINSFFLLIINRPTIFADSCLFHKVWKTTTWCHLCYTSNIAVKPDLPACDEDLCDTLYSYYHSRHGS